MSEKTSTILATANLGVSAIIGAFVIYAVTGQNELYRLQGQQSAQLGQLIEATTRLEDFNLKITNNFNNVDNKIDAVERKIELAQINPSTMMAKAGFSVDNDIQLVWFGNEVVAFPRTAEAEKTLQEKNYLQVKLNPAMEGYVLDAPTADIVKQSVLQDSKRNEEMQRIIRQLPSPEILSDPFKGLISPQN